MQEIGVYSSKIFLIQVENYFFFPSTHSVHAGEGRQTGQTQVGSSDKFTDLGNKGLLRC
jgi:hypothetical protein